MEMTMRPAGQQQALSDADSQFLAQAAGTLPGNWYLDPDLCARPLAWIRSNPANRHAIGFERRGASVWVSLHDETTSPSNNADALPFDTLQAAFVYLKARLLAQIPQADWDAVISSHQRNPLPPALDTNAAPVVPVMHPRISARIRHVALVRKQDMLLTQLDRMTDSLYCTSSSAERPLIQTMQDIRDRLTCLEIENLAEFQAFGRDPARTDGSSGGMGGVRSGKSRSRQLNELPDRGPPLPRCIANRMNRPYRNQSK